MISSRSLSSSSSADENDRLLASHSDDELLIEITPASSRCQDRFYRYHSRLYCSQSPFFRKLEDCIDILERQLAQIDIQLDHRGNLDRAYWASFIVTLLSLVSLPFLTYIAFDMLFLPLFRLQHEPVASQGDRLVSEILQFPDNNKPSWCDNDDDSQSSDMHAYYMRECIDTLLMTRDYQKNPALKALLERFSPLYDSWESYAEDLQTLNSLTRMAATFGTFGFSLILVIILATCIHRDLMQYDEDQDLDCIQPDSRLVSPEDNQKLIHLITLLNIPAHKITKQGLLDTLKEIKSKAVNKSSLFFTANQNDDLRLANDIHKIIYNNLVEKIAEETCRPLHDWP